MLRQKRVSARIHGFIPYDQRGVRANEVREPPGFERAVASKPIGDPKPPEDPTGSLLSEVERCGASPTATGVKLINVVTNNLQVGNATRMPLTL